MDEPIATHVDVTTIMGILGDIRDEAQAIRPLLEEREQEQRRLEELRRAAGTPTEA